MTRIPGFSYVHPIACALTDMSIEKKGGEKRRREGGGGVRHFLNYGVRSSIYLLEAVKLKHISTS